MNRILSSFVIFASLGPMSALTGCKREADVPADNAKVEEKPDEHHNEVKLSAEAINRYGVQVGEVRRQVLVPTFIAPARVTLNADAMAHVGSARSGRVVELRAKKGDTVKKGDTLLVVESPEFGEAQNDYLHRLMAVEIARSEVEIARPAVEIAQQTVDIAQSSYDRGKKLMEESQGITVTEVQKREADLRAAQGAFKAAQAEVKVAESKVRSAEAEAKAAENRLHLLGLNQAAVETLAKSREIQPRFSLVAPIDGQVLEREVTLGELVGPDKESLLVIADLSTLWVIADVPELRLREIAKEARADVRLVAATADKLQGKVSFIDPTMDPGTRTARVRIEVQNTNGFIRPGMFAQVEIFTPLTAASAQPVLVIPEDAVQTIEGVTVMFMPVSGEENTFVKKVVSVGKSVAGMVPVEAGLKEGDKIVISGSFIFKAELGKGAAGED